MLVLWYSYCLDSREVLQWSVEMCMIFQSKQHLNHQCFLLQKFVARLFCRLSKGWIISRLSSPLPGCMFNCSLYHIFLGMLRNLFRAQESSFWECPISGEGFFSVTWKRLQPILPNYLIYPTFHLTSTAHFVLINYFTKRVRGGGNDFLKK